MPQNLQMEETKRVRARSDRRFDPSLLNIVLVGEDTETYELFTRLKSLDYNAFFAESFDVARDAFTTGTVDYDILITPLKIGDVHSFDFMDWLAEEFPEKDAPHLIIVPLQNIEIITTCLEHGASDVIPLPCTDTMLKSRVNAFLRSHWMQTEMTRVASNDAELRQSRQEIQQMKKALEDREDRLSYLARMTQEHQAKIQQLQETIEQQQEELVYKDRQLSQAHDRTAFLESKLTSMLIK